MGDCKVYVGNLPYDTQERELDDLFYKYGRINDIFLASNPPGYAFIVFDHPRDADYAVKQQDGRRFGGRRMKVEISRRDKRGGRDDRRDDRRQNGGRNFDKPFGGKAAQKTEWRVIVDGLPQGCSWQDMKDFIRESGAGTAQFTKTLHNGRGIAEFATQDEMENAIARLDNADFRGSRLTAEKDPDAAAAVGGFRGHGGPPRGRPQSRSRSPRRDHHSRSRSRDRRSRSRSRGRRSFSRERGNEQQERRSRSRSPPRNDEQQRSRSRSRSPHGENRDTSDRSPQRENSAPEANKGEHTE